jgi:hypothetical protein
MDPETTENETVETGKGLRAKLEEALAENRELKAEKRVAAFEKAGLATDTGLGKAIFKEYDGELSEDAVREYAKTEYGWEAAPEPTHPDARQITEEQARLDQAGETAGSVVAPTQEDILAKAEAEGDVNTTMAIKGAQVAEMFRGR